MAMTVMLASTLFAQTPITFGLKGGGNLAKHKVDEGTDFESRVGFHVGALASININSRWGVQPELVYSSQGSKDDGTNDQINRQTYLNIPVLLQLKSRSGFRVNTGPYVGLLLDSERQVQSVKTDTKDWYKKADFGWVLGASYVTGSGLGIDVRQNFGIAQIQKENDPLTNEWRNTVFQAGLFYQFGGRPKRTESSN